MTLIFWFRVFIDFWTFLFTYSASFSTYLLRIIMNKITTGIPPAACAFFFKPWKLTRLVDFRIQVHQSWYLLMGYWLVPYYSRKTLFNSAKTYYLNEKGSMSTSPSFFFSFWEVCGPNICWLKFFVFLNLWGLYYFRHRPRGWLFKIVLVTTIRSSNNFIQ